MAVSIANANSTWLGAATWAAVETGTGAQALIRANNTTLATAATVTSPTFTVTNTKVIDGCLLYVYMSSGTAGTGTFKVDLQKGGVSQASVTVNKSDLPDATNSSPSPVFFKFTGTATGDGGANWTIVLTTTSGTGSGVITYTRNSATTGDATRALRTNTSVNAAAGMDFYICAELTGAAAKTNRTVTMDETANTDYCSGTVNSTSVFGGIVGVGWFGTLTFDNTINSLLRLSGDLRVYASGTLNIGSSGAEIPRNKTAILEFDQASADGDFGLTAGNNSTLNIYGLSRTSGKNVTKCKLTSSVSTASVLSAAATTTNTTLTAGTGTAGGTSANGTSLLSTSAVDTTTNATHSFGYSGPSISNTTQTATVWLARGTGTNNRFMRFTVGNNAVHSSVTNGFFVDIDLQAGTVGTVTAVGNGTATSASITAVGTGFVIRMTGKLSSGSATPFVMVNICSAAGTTSFAGANNQAVIADGFALVTASSISDTTLNVDTDTGWLSGDVIWVAGTNRNAEESECFVLNANAGASSMTTTQYPLGAAGYNLGASSYGSGNNTSHSATSPLATEIGLVTRNVKIRSTSQTLSSYLYGQALAAVNLSWAEFYYMGVSGTLTKRSIEFDAGATSTAKTVSFCSGHDGDIFGIVLAASTNVSCNVTVSNCVFANTNSGAVFTISSAIDNVNEWTLTECLTIRNTTGGAYSFGDCTGTVTNNVSVGNAIGGFGFRFNESITSNLVGLLGTFSGNTAHSSAGHGMLWQQAAYGTCATFTAYRCNQTGITENLNVSNNALYTDLTLFGNSTNISSLAQSLELWINNGTICGDSTFASSTGFACSSGTYSITLNWSNVDMLGGSGIYVPHTATDLNIQASGSVESVRANFIGCKFGAPALLHASTKAGLDDNSFFSFQRFNGTAGDHRTEMKYGQLKTDSAIYNTASPSMRMTPNSASSKLESAPYLRGILVPVLNGVTKNVQVAVRKSQAADPSGANYNGNQPRLIQRKNAALGQNADVVLDTMSTGSLGAWETLTGTTSSPTDDGAFELIVDCDGTTGWVNVDDWAITA